MDLVIYPPKRKIDTKSEISLSHDDEFAAIFKALVFKIVCVRPRNDDSLQF